MILTDRPIYLLDHGSVSLVEHWGSDERIVEAARMSTAKGFQGWGPAIQCKHCGVKGGPDVGVVVHCQANDTGHDIGPYGPPGDEKLLKYLYVNKHMTPFEMAGMVLEVQAPIFVFREWHRHRTQSYNELSARYTPIPDVCYIPTVERLMQNAGTSNKQAGTVAKSVPLTPEAADAFRRTLAVRYTEAESLYQDALYRGVPKELARVIVPVGRYSRMRASANLRNWLQFLTLRMDPAAQWEIRQYAEAVSQVVAGLFPRTHALFLEGSARG